MEWNGVLAVLQTVEETWWMKRVRVIMSSEVEEERIRGVIYSQDPSRLHTWNDGVALFAGDHGEHRLVQEPGSRWRCDCHAFQRLGQLTDCRHIIAIVRILGQLAAPEPWATMTQSVASKLELCHSIQEVNHVKSLAFGFGFHHFLSGNMLWCLHNVLNGYGQTV